MDEKQRLAKIIMHFGITEQTRQAIEELNELAVAINKVHRHGLAADRIAAVTSEIADVMIMLEQMKIIFGISDEKISEMKELKIKRIERVIE